MKNIHILPTDKPSRLWTNNLRRRLELDEFPSQHPTNIAKHIYITNDEEIKEGDWYENNGVIFKADDVFDEGNNPNNSNPRVTDFNNKIILTDNKDLIKDGVQPISNEFLEWFVKNPSCEEVEIESWQTKGEWDLDYKIIIPKEETTAYHYLSCCRSIEECHCGKYPKQIKCYCGHTTMCDCSPIDEPKQGLNLPLLEQKLDEALSNETEESLNTWLKEKRDKQETTLEEAAKSNFDNKTARIPVPTSHWINSEFLQIQNFKEGANWQQERMYSEEDLREAFKQSRQAKIFEKDMPPVYENFEQWFEQFKKK